MDIAETVDQKIRALIRYFSVNSIPVLSKIMGMVLFLYAGWFIFSFTYSGDYGANWAMFVGTLIITICATLILLDLSFNINRAIGLYAIAIGGNRAIKMSNYLTMNGNNEMMTAVIFIFALVMIGVSINLCITGVVFLKGETRGRISMIFSSAFMMAATLSAAMVMAQFSGNTFVEVLMTNPEYTIMLALYLLLICMLETETIRMSCRDEHYISILNGIRKINSSSDTAFIYRGQAKVLSEAFSDRTVWRSVDDSGPVEAEYTFVLYNRIDDMSYVTVQKWKDEDDLYFTIIETVLCSMHIGSHAPV